MGRLFCTYGDNLILLKRGKGKGVKKQARVDV
jgi:hypothetical protein